MPARCFLALDLPAAARTTLADTRAALLDRAPAWEGEKWVAAELLHVTVKFIGALDDAAVPDLLAGLETALDANEAFELTLAGVRAVPSARRATMLWATLDGDTSACGALHARADLLLSERFGVEADRRAFSPHVTLVRSRATRRVPAGALAAAEAVLSAAGKDPDGFVSVRALTLYASTLGPAGPTYETLGEVPLGGAHDAPPGR
jgi:2'-5' RNA ligase